jgi:site-specific DNA recombinase
VLRSPRIAGLRSHLGEIVAKGQWEPIISEDEHHRLVAVTSNRHLHGPKRAPRTFPLVGFLICGRCGQPLRSVTSAQAERKRRRYVCRGGEGGGCGGIQIRAEFIEDAVRDYVFGVIADPELHDRLLAAAPRPHERVHEDAMVGLGQLEAARQRLTDLAVDGTITVAEVRRKTSELDQQTQQTGCSPGRRPHRRLPRDRDGAAAAWKSRGINYQRTLINLLIETITVNPATRMAPGRFDIDRLDWSLRA